jgi:hypothetical protein
MKLDCLLDFCPKNSKSTVDMRLCCKPCQHYGAKPWSEFAEVTCLHPEAQKASEEQKNINSELFRACASVGHLMFVGEKH